MHRSVDLLFEEIIKGTVVAVPHQGELVLALVRHLASTTCVVRTYWVRRGRKGHTDFVVDSGDCVVIPHTRLRRGHEIHERLIQEASQCQTH